MFGVVFNGEDNCMVGNDDDDAWITPTAQCLSSCRQQDLHPVSSGASCPGSFFPVPSSFSLSFSHQAHPNAFPLFSNIAQVPAVLRISRYPQALQTGRSPHHLIAGTRLPNFLPLPTPLPGTSRTLCRPNIFELFPRQVASVWRAMSW